MTRTYQYRLWPSGRVSQGFKAQSIAEILDDYDPFQRARMVPLIEVDSLVASYLADYFGPCPKIFGEGF